MGLWGSPWVILVVSHGGGHEEAARGGAG